MSTLNGGAPGLESGAPVAVNDRLKSAVYSYYSKTRGAESPRAHLGASIIGKECERELWFSFRMIAKPKFPGRIYRLFETGHREEDRLISNLKEIGFEDVYDRDPDTGEQFRVEAFGGHFGGSMDGILKNVMFPGIPYDCWIVLEMKTSNEKGFKRLEREGLKKCKPIHYSQMQIYMGKTSMRQALYVCVNKNTDDLYFELIEFDQLVFDELMDRAKRIVFSREPLNRIGGPDCFHCKFCDFQTLCHEGYISPAYRSCRSCVHATPKENGTWLCEKKEQELSLYLQIEGCDEHVLIPTILPWPWKPVEDDQIEFESPSGPISTKEFTSLDILQTQHQSLTNPTVKQVKEIIGGTVSTKKAWEA